MVDSDKTVYFAHNEICQKILDSMNQQTACNQQLDHYLRAIWWKVENYHRKHKKYSCACAYVVVDICMYAR